MTEWTRLPGMRHVEYCDAHGHRLVIEASHWSRLPFHGEHHEEYQGFIGGVRVGTWNDLDTAKRTTLELAAQRAEAGALLFPHSTHD